MARGRYRRSIDGLGATPWAGPDASRDLDLALLESMVQTATTLADRSCLADRILSARIRGHVVVDMDR